jgi:3'-phosphoadenosine 5'-phosphosulfate sulfotransferase (PAPS reductase)/FAD synthetase
VRVRPVVRNVQQHTSDSDHIQRQFACFILNSHASTRSAIYAVTFYSAYKDSAVMAQMISREKTS